MRRREKPPPRVRLPAGYVPPPELLDPVAEVWRDFEAYREWMQSRGWPMETRDRIRVVAPEIAGPGLQRVSPARREGRRWRAAKAWGASVGLRDPEQLRALLAGRAG